MVGSLELVVDDLELLALVNENRQLAVVARGDLRNDGHLGVRIVLLLVIGTDTRRGFGEIAFAVQGAVLEIRLLDDLGLADRGVALHVDRRLEAHFALHVEDDLDAFRQTTDIGHDLLEFLG